MMCDFVGLEVEGIYRLNGQHSKVTRLLELFLAGNDVIWYVQNTSRSIKCGG